MAKRQGSLLKRGATGLTPRGVEKAYEAARERYAALGIDTETALDRARGIPLSVHCWQTDDVRGTEASAGGDGGGIQATGSYPGAARHAGEIRRDLETVAGLVPGALRFNLHACYAETDGKPVARAELKPRHFAGWADWAAEGGWALDFNPTCFGHPMVRDGMTLSSPEEEVRSYWIEHAKACRRIGAGFAKRFGACTVNLWIPDGRKDLPADRWGPRERLEASLDAVLERRHRGVVDAVESKLFGLGVEAYTVGSHEFYLAYTARHPEVALCLDLGHFHPTESVADKLSAVAPHLEHVLIHASRGVRWDSDHVVLTGPDLQALCDEAVAGGALAKMLWALDFFDASLNRIAAYVLGVRAVRKALLLALLQPWDLAAGFEYGGQTHYRLALEEHRRELPFGAVWDRLCLEEDRPLGLDWISEVERYEREVLAARD